MLWFRVLSVFLSGGIVFSAGLIAGDPYESFKELPSSNASGYGTGSPYESFSSLPQGSQERHPTLQNEYSTSPTGP